MRQTLDCPNLRYPVTTNANHPVLLQGPAHWPRSSHPNLSFGVTVSIPDTKSCTGFPCICTGLGISYALYSNTVSKANLTAPSRQHHN